MGIRHHLYLPSRRRLALLIISYGFTFPKNIGYQFSKQMTTDIIIQALTNAYVAQRPKDEITLHTNLDS